MTDDKPFEDLPKYDPTKFEPPAWAQSSAFDYTRKNGESSKSVASPDDSGVNLNQSDSDDEEEVWEDAQEGLEDAVEETPDGLVFTIAEMRKLVERAQVLKNEGNTLYTSRPPEPEKAIEKYQKSLELLPPVPKLPTKEKAKTKAPPIKEGGGLQEITDEEAAAIAQSEIDALARASRVPSEREEVEGLVRECGKACHGNLAACWALLKEDKKAVEACTKALELDPDYTKALHRRATASDRLGTWSSLTSAKEDYEHLLTLISTSSPQYPSTRSALFGLPRRIAAQQEKEKDEMLNQLKELGNGLLGKFGLSTDMFKFEQQAGGGYGVKFER